MTALSTASPLRVAVSLQDDRPLAETLELARLAESLGFAEIGQTKTVTTGERSLKPRPSQV